MFFMCLRVLGHEAREARNRDRGCGQSSRPIESKLALCFCAQLGCPISRRFCEKWEQNAFHPVSGEMAEWLKAHAWKACLGETLTWVRIPLSPPVFYPHKHWRLPKITFLCAKNGLGLFLIWIVLAHYR
jgi:hypothetical protein